MDRLLKLQSNPGARKKRKTVGRGPGSGHGTYSTRGMNGQRQRTGSSKSPGFEGGQTPLFRRLPKFKGFTNPNHVSFQVVNVGSLNVFNDNDDVDVVKLYEKSLISSKSKPVKLLGDGEITKKLNVKVDRISGSAKLKIEKAKGSVTELMAAAEKTASKEAK
ncbi:MAG: 50S ribosomal protein L15 [Candidatus Gracilibacteria bacterium]